MSEQPDWLDKITRKRPEVILLLHAMVLHGRKHGHVTAEDVHHIPVSHPNCRGAAMKYLGKMGFVKDQVIRGSTEQSHGHWLMRWKLDDLECGMKFLAELQRLATRISIPTEQQTLGV